MIQTWTDRLHDAGISFYGQEIQQESPILAFLLTWILPLVIFIAIGQYMSKKLMDRAGGTNAMSFGKSNAKVYVKPSEGIKFSDVAGEDEAKESLTEIVEHLHDPSKYREIGASMPKGILLVGLPGTGKTMLAKTVAGEANVPFFSISGSEFVEMFVGMGASKVKQAKRCGICLSRPRRRHPASFLLMRLMPSAKSGMASLAAMTNGNRPLTSC